LHNIFEYLLYTYKIFNIIVDISTKNSFLAIKCILMQSFAQKLYALGKDGNFTYFQATNAYLVCFVQNNNLT